MRTLDNIFFKSGADQELLKGLGFRYDTCGPDGTCWYNPKIKGLIIYSGSGGIKITKLTERVLEVLIKVAEKGLIYVKNT